MCMLVAAGIGWFAFPVFVKPLESDFGWTRTQVMIAIGIWAVVSGAFSPVVGLLIDKLGARRILLVGLAFSGLCSIAFGSIQSLGQMYVVLFFASIATVSSTYMPVVSIVPQWFVHNRGKAMSIAMMGMALGGFVVPNISEYLIKTVGWRWSWRFFGLAIWVLLLPPVAIWVRSRPSDIGLKALGGGESSEENGFIAPEADISTENSTDNGFSVRQALRMSNFWGMAVADLMNATAFVSLSTHLVALSIDAGIESKVAAFAYSSINGVALLGMVVIGMAADRFNKPVMLSLSYGLPMVATMFLFDLEAPGPLFCFTILFGLCSSGKAILWPLVLNDIFGARAYSTVMGILIVFYTAGSAIGAPLMAWIADTTGSYRNVFIICITCFTISGLSMAFGTMRKHNP